MASLPAEQSEEWSNLNYAFIGVPTRSPDGGTRCASSSKVLNLVEPYARIHAHGLGARSQMQEQRAASRHALRRTARLGCRPSPPRGIERARVQLLASMPAVVADGPSPWSAATHTHV